MYYYSSTEYISISAPYYHTPYLHSVQVMYNPSQSLYPFSPHYASGGKASRPSGMPPSNYPQSGNEAMGILAKPIFPLWRTPYGVLGTENWGLPVGIGYLSKPSWHVCSTSIGGCALRSVPRPFPLRCCDFPVRSRRSRGVEVKQQQQYNYLCYPSLPA